MPHLRPAALRLEIHRRSLHQLFEQVVRNREPPLRIPKRHEHRIATRAQRTVAPREARQLAIHAAISSRRASIGFDSSSEISSARRMNAYTAHIASLLCRGRTRKAQ